MSSWLVSVPDIAIELSRGCTFVELSRACTAEQLASRRRHRVGKCRRRTESLKDLVLVYLRTGANVGESRQAPAPRVLGSGPGRPPIGAIIGERICDAGKKKIRGASNGSAGSEYSRNSTPITFAFSKLPATARTGTAFETIAPQKFPSFRKRRKPKRLSFNPLVSFSMELPDDFQTSWRTVVAPGKPCQIALSRKMQCCVAGIALEQSNLPPSGKTVLLVSVNRSPPVAVISFIVGQCEAAEVDLRFGYGETIVFTSSGAPIPILIFGSASGGNPVATK